MHCGCGSFLLLHCFNVSLLFEICAQAEYLFYKQTEYNKLVHTHAYITMLHYSVKARVPAGLTNQINNIGL